jgi:hypothetical protein
MQPSTYNGIWQELAYVVVLGLVLGCRAAYSAIDVGPRAPCGREEPVPTYAAVAELPNVQTWKGVSLERPDCLPWPRDRFRLVVALAGSFNHNGDGASLLERFGAISKMRGIPYWSVTERASRVLIKDAFALDGPDPSSRRYDFKPEEMKPGTEFYFAEEDNRSGMVVYRMQVLEAGPNRVVVTTENATPVRRFGLTLFPPQSLRAAYFVQRRDFDVWTFYGLSANGEEASALASSSEASYVNRATALYRHFTSAPK